MNQGPNHEAKHRAAASVVTQPIATRCFSIEDSKRFAGFCGDVNPMHVDAVAARRTPAGEPVIHGVHLLLWALEATMQRNDAFRRIRVMFQKPVVAGDRVSVSDARDASGSSRLRLFVNGAVAVRIDLSREFSTAPVAPPDLAASTPVLERFEAPRELALEAIAAMRGRIDAASIAPLAAALYPEASRALGAVRVAALARLSTLVGMECPGLHSIFASLDIDLAGPQTSCIDYGVTGVDESFRRVSMSVAGCGIGGRIAAFARVPPVEQASMRELAAHVRPGEFAGAVALVVGASRGLGALAARIVAAGGGRVIGAYNAGASDAAAVQADIRAAGGACEMFAFDALSPDVDAFTRRLPEITHLYYFASPKIVRRSEALFDAGLFDRFVSFYVDGFQRLCAAVPRSTAGLKALNPSTVMLDEPARQMIEYCMAKAAAEVLCDEMARVTPGLSIAHPRLPRILTDQTASIVPMRTEPAIDVLLPVIRALHGSDTP